MTCAGPFSLTDIVSRLFLVVLLVLGASAIISSLASYWSDLCHDSYEFSAISSSRDEEMSRGIEEMEAELNAGRCRRMQDFCNGIAKILQGLQRFRNHSENFAIPVKFCYAHFFAMIVKFHYHSENSLS